jgi:hypothetical protein
VARETAFVPAKKKRRANFNPALAEERRTAD